MIPRYVRPEPVLLSRRSDDDARGRAVERTLSEWREASPELMELLRAQATWNGIEIIRDREVRLNCLMPEGDMVTFTVFWSRGDAMNVRLLRSDM